MVLCLSVVGALQAAPLGALQSWSPCTNQKRMPVESPNKKLTQSQNKQFSNQACLWGSYSPEEKSVRVGRGTGSPVTGKRFPRDRGTGSPSLIFQM